MPFVFGIAPVLVGGTGRRISHTVPLFLVRAGGDFVDALRHGQNEDHGVPFDIDSHHVPPARLSPQQAYSATSAHRVQGRRKPYSAGGPIRI